MRLLEHEGKSIFQEFDIPVPDGEIIESNVEVAEAVDKLGLPLVLKAQVPAGGRGKAGGIKVAKSEGEAEKIVEELLGSDLKGYEVTSLLAEEELEIVEEMYCGIIGNREKGVPEVIVSSKGGVDIEQVAEETPKEIKSAPVNPLSSFEAFQSRDIMKRLGLGGDVFANASQVLYSLYRVFSSYDLKLAEINPLVVTKGGEVTAADSKIVIDDHSLFRHPKYKDKKVRYTQNRLEREGEEKGVNYVDLEGNIAIMANGAGLAMATMDLVNFEGGSPAAFLDTGGGLNKKRMKDAVKLLLKKAESDPKVRVILLNVRFQISPPDAMANGLLDALEQTGKVTASIIVVLRGRSRYVEKAKELLKNSKVDIYSDVEEGVSKAVKIARG